MLFQHHRLQAPTLLAIVMALAGCSSTSEPAGTGGSGVGGSGGSGSGGSDSNGSGGNAPPTTALLDTALECKTNAGTGVSPGDALKKVTLKAPNAICNDGSPAVMFVRRAADAANESNWVFHLQGGGGCGGPDCAERWCTRTEKMSSKATPPSMVGKGIMKRSADNQLGDANQVFLYYCSSDNWAGRATDAVIPAEGENPAFRLHFRGEAIHNAALDALEEGLQSDDGSVTMPKFEGDGYALWTGTSGGCHGVSHTADRFAARAKSKGFSPYIVCDANFGPSPNVLPEGAELQKFLEDRAARFELTGKYADTLRDESCMEALSDDPFLCELPGYVLSNHVVGAPLFIRMDLGDPSIEGSYIAAGFSKAQFAQGVRDSLLNAAASKGVQTPPRPVGAYGPGCQQHVGMTNNEWFFDTTVKVDDVDVSFHDGVVEWMAGRDVVAVDTVPPSTSKCGKTTDDMD